MEIKLLKGYELEEYLVQFCELYRCCFNDYIDTNIVAQRYLENPLHELQMCVALDGNQIVSNYSVSPVMLARGKDIFKCALSLNTMTHPDYVGQGLFVRLANRLYNHLASEGYCMVYGFPNYISNRTFVNKLSWKDIYEIPTLELSVTKLLKYDSTNVKQVDYCDFSPPINKLQLHIHKNKDYIRWRYNEKPNVSYYYLKTENGSWCIYKFYENIINIVELHVPVIRDIYDIVGYLIDIALDCHKERLTVWETINTELHINLEKIGFRNRYPITYFAGLDLGLSEKVGIDIYDHRNWCINMGDDNVY